MLSNHRQVQKHCETHTTKRVAHPNENIFAHHAMNTLSNRVRQHQEKKGALFWNDWVKDSLKLRSFPMGPICRFRSTMTTGIWTN